MTGPQLCEALRVLEQPSRDLDDRIWRWVNDRKLNPTAPGWQYDLLDAPLYTSCVTAALTLLPVVGELGHPNERMDYILEHINGGMTIGCRVGTGDPDATEWGCNAATAVSRAAIVAHLRETVQ